MSVLRSSFGDFTLQRWPASSDRSLQAWDAADELLLAHVYEQQLSLLADGARLLLCNDAHGALSCALHAFKPVVWSDSCLSHAAVRHNWEKNRLAGHADCVDSLTNPEGPFKLVLIKVPKTSALLEDQLARIRPLLDENGVVIAASLVRHLHRTAFTLFEKYIGAVTTSLAVKKARLVFCTALASKPSINSPYPDAYNDVDLGMSLVNHANVFCRDRVDVGARFFLDHCSHLPQANDIIDLACGNGILGINVQRSQPHAHLHFIDESYMCVASAQDNYASLIEKNEQAPVFSVGNGLEEVASQATDLIVCNPPFHVQHAIADDTARSFFNHAARCLRPGGQIWIVANRHLKYRSYLKRHFSHCDVVAGNRKFVVLRAWS